jgi:hypothetical protein
LTSAVTDKCFKMITGRHLQIIKSSSDFKLPKFTPCNKGNAYELPDSVPL